MAEYGLRIYNNQGSVQIDSRYRNIVHLSSINLTDIQGGYYDLEIEDNKWYVIEFDMFNDTTFTPMLISNKFENNMWKKTYRIFRGGTRIHAFGYGAPVASNAYGLRVYAENSRLVFDSALKPFSVIDRFTGVLTNAQIDSTSDISIMAKAYNNFQRRIGFCISRNIQVSGYTGGNFYQRTLMFNTSRQSTNVVGRVKFATAYGSRGYADTEASTGTFTDSLLKTYDFCVVDCSGLPYP